METEADIEYEGRIKIPEITIKPTIFSKENNLNIHLIRINTLPELKKPISNFTGFCTEIQIEDILNLTTKIDRFRMDYNRDINIATTKASEGSINDKIKKVTFTTVEIIRVDNYKKYNKLNTSKKNENYNSFIDDNCAIV